MEIAPEVREIEALAQLSNVKLAVALKRARVAHTTYLRWKAGSEPKTGTIRRVRAAIAELEAAA